MTDRDASLRRADAALRRAVRIRPGDLDHPAVVQLEAWIDGRLDEADHEIVQSHIEQCDLCAEDLSDLQVARAELDRYALPVRSGRPAPTRWRRVAVAAGAVAAAAVLLVWSRGVRVNERAAPPVAAAPAASEAVAATRLTADEQAIVARAVASRRLDLPADLDRLTPPAGTLLGQGRAAAAMAPLTPAGTAVLSPRPTFTWRALAGATAYTVSVVDERFVVVASRRVTGTAWTPTADLPRGVTLAWQVTAHLSGRDVLAPAPPQPEARVRVVDAPTAAAIDATRARLADEPLALGVLLARAGLLVDAARELERARTRPADAAPASALLADLESRGVTP